MAQDNTTIILIGAMVFASGGKKKTDKTNIFVAKTIHGVDRKSVAPVFSPLHPTVIVSCKNCCVGSLSKIVYPNMMLICYS